MTFVIPNNNYSAGTGTNSTSPFVEVFFPRDPTAYDIYGPTGQYQIQQKWWNTVSNVEWILIGYSSFNNQVSAVWHLVSAAGVPESFVVQSGTSPVTPNNSHQIIFNGSYTAAMGVPVQTVGSLNTMDLAVQLASAQASSNPINAGLCSFNSNNFSVDSNGYVQLVGGSNFSINFIPIYSNQTYTPSAGMVYVMVQVLGGGGGGGGAVTGAESFAVGSGGGAGGYGYGVFSASTIGSSQAVTVGAGASSGLTGGTSTFGSLIVCAGGVGGAASASVNSITCVAGGAGGSGSTTQGTPGGAGFTGQFSGDGIVVSGQGGSSFFGGGGASVCLTEFGQSDGNNAESLGGGGSGAAVFNPLQTQSGGAGAGGVVFITEYILV